MRILHVDSGRTMRGGQWQVLRLMRGLARADVESHAAGAAPVAFVLASGV